LKVKEGDRVLLIDEKGKKFLVRVEKGKTLSTHYGIIELEKLIGADFGDFTYTHNKRGKFYIVEPVIPDLMMKVKRETQIIYPKDAAIIIMWLGIKEGSRVIEIGTGSGSMTIALANAVGENGKVYSYDRNEKFQKNAIKNVENAGLIDRVEFKIRQAHEGFDEKEVDAVFIDLPSPWEALDPAVVALKGGGRLGVLSPTCNQIETMSVKMKERGFIDITSFEILLRHMLPRKGMTRPLERMVSHTGYLLFGIKTSIRLPE